MANFSTYKITSKTTNSSWIRINLDSQVNYSGGREFYIDLEVTLPFTEWDAGDTIDIDTDKTRDNSSGKTFSFWDNVAYLRATRWESKYWEAVREKNSSASSASTRYSNLERERNEWRTKYYDKNSDYEDYKERYEDIRGDLDNSQRERIRIANENASERLRQEQEKSTLRVEKAKTEEKLENAKTRETGLTKQLEDNRKELGLVRLENKGEIAKVEKNLEQERKLLEGVRQSLADLRVKNERESAEKDNQIREKEDKLQRKEEETKELQAKLGLSREEVLEQKIRSKAEKLDLFATDLEIDLEQIQNLRDYYEEITRSRHNRDNVRELERKIVLVKKELTQSKIQMNKIQKICRKCEKLAELRLKLDQVLTQQNQFQAQIEVPLNNN